LCKSPFKSLIDLWLVLCITVFYRGNNAIDFKLFVEEKQVSIYATTHSLGQLDEKINSMEIFKFWNFEAKGYKGNHSLKNYLASYLYFLC